MSVLSFPRIYFKGNAECDPCTFNNNDFQAFQTYDAASAALNWPFVATQKPPITPGPRVAAEWNIFGGHAVSFVQYQDKLTTVTSGDITCGQPVANADLSER
jgi:hypothetical protein